MRLLLKVISSARENMLCEAKDTNNDAMSGVIAVLQMSDGPEQILRYSIRNSVPRAFPFLGGQESPPRPKFREKTTLRRPTRALS